MSSRIAFEFFGILAMCACTTMFTALWWAAYLNQGAIKMTISSYGERYPELLVWFIIMPLVLYAVGSYLDRTILT